MSIVIASHTDIGQRKEVNQDGYAIRVAESDIGEVAFAIVCDGMGGMDQGEFASSSVVRSFAGWFNNEFQYKIDDVRRGNFQNIFDRWNEMTIYQNERLVERGREMDANIGTTLTAVLIVRNCGLAIAHIGDTRAYKLSDKMELLTEDHTFIANEIKSGRMTPEQAQIDPRRNALLQGVGVNSYLDPYFFCDGSPQSGTFLICTDGFRHVISEDEIFNALTHQGLDTEESIQAELISLTGECMNRGETDNITAVVIKVI